MRWRRGRLVGRVDRLEAGWEYAGVGAVTVTNAAGVVEVLSAAEWRKRHPLPRMDVETMWTLRPRRAKA